MNRFVAVGLSGGGDMVSTPACLCEIPFEAFGPVTCGYDEPAECETAPARPVVYCDGCAAATEWYPIGGGGHPWPGSPIEFEALGDTTQRISTSDVRWQHVFG